MGSIRRERQVLKLVHPGRHVEVHREPITAAEVMRRNPRHCIARPDVFEFPWIVVKPESVLLPGSVFFIVPNHTIYNLLKTRGQSNQSPSSIQNQSPNNLVHQQLQQHSPVSSYAGMSSKLQKYMQYIKGLFSRKEKVGEKREVEGKIHIFNKLFLPLFFLSSFSQRGTNCQRKKMSPDVESLCKYEWDERSQNQSQVELWPKVISYRDTQNKIEEEFLEQSTFETTSYNAIEYQTNSKDIGTELPKKDVNLEFGSHEQVTMLKSCLRRQDSIRKSLNLKVSFNIPIKKQEKQMELNVFRAKFSCYLNW